MTRIDVLMWFQYGALADFICFVFFFQAEDGIRDLVRSRGLGDVYKRQVMSRAIKDIFCRYKTLKGFQVKRKGGWDTHGLPTVSYTHLTLPTSDLV